MSARRSVRRSPAVRDRTTHDRARRAAPRPVSARRWLRHLAHHLPIAIAGDDAEGVHQVRVAAGRIAVWLEMSGRAVLRSDLRAFRRVASPVRDADVLLERGPPEAFATRLRALRERERADMIGYLRSDRARALRQALALLPPIPRDVAMEALPSFRDRVLRRGDALASHPEPQDEDFHSLRRAVRKLRYALEWLGLPAAPVKALQQTFGDLNDLAVELRVLEETGAAAELPEHARELRAGLVIAKREALAAWIQSRAGVAEIGGS